MEVVGGWWWWWWWVGGGGGGWVVVTPPLFHAFLESYCSLENPLKKGSPALALAHYSSFNHMLPCRILIFADLLMLRWLFPGGLCLLGLYS